MPTFVLTCLDRAGALSVRMAARPDHLAYVKSQGTAIKLAGPLLDDAGDMAGSLLIIEAADMDAARAFTAADPYAIAGLFQSVDIRAIKVSITNA